MAIAFDFEQNCVTVTGYGCSLTAEDDHSLGVVDVGLEDDVDAVGHFLRGCSLVLDGFLLPFSEFSEKFHKIVRHRLHRMKFFRGTL